MKILLYFGMIDFDLIDDDDECSDDNDHVDVDDKIDSLNVQDEWWPRMLWIAWYDHKMMCGIDTLQHMIHHQSFVNEHIFSINHTFNPTYNNVTCLQYNILYVMMTSSKCRHDGDDIMI